MISPGILGQLLLSFHYNNIDPSGNIIQSVSLWLSLPLLLGKTVFIRGEKEVWGQINGSCVVPHVHVVNQVKVPGTMVSLKSCHKLPLLLPPNNWFLYAGWSRIHVLKPLPGLSVFLCWKLVSKFIFPSLVWALQNGLHYLVRTIGVSGQILASV